MMLHDYISVPVAPTAYGVFPAIRNSRTWLDMARVTGVSTTAGQIFD